MKLNEIKEYIWVTIISISMPDKDTQRLFFMGIYEGAKIMKLQEAPLGDPILYFISGNQIILRKKDTMYMEVEVRI